MTSDAEWLRAVARGENALVRVHEGAAANLNRIADLIERLSPSLKDADVEAVARALRGNLGAQGIRLVRDVAAKPDVRILGDCAVSFNELAEAAIAALPPSRATEYAQPCDNHEYIEPGCPDCGKLA